MLRQICLLIITLTVVTLGLIIHLVMFRLARKGKPVGYKTGFLCLLSVPTVWILPFSPFVHLPWMDSAACNDGLPWEHHVVALVMAVITSFEVAKIWSSVDTRWSHLCDDTFAEILVEMLPSRITGMPGPNSLVAFLYLEAVLGALSGYLIGCWAALFVCGGPSNRAFIILTVAFSLKMMFSLFVGNWTAFCHGDLGNELLQNQTRFGVSTTAVVLELRTKSAMECRIQAQETVRKVWRFQVFVEVVQIIFLVAFANLGPPSHTILLYVFVGVSLCATMKVVYYLMIPLLDNAALDPEQDDASLQSVSTSIRSDGSVGSWIFTSPSEACFVEPAYFRVPCRSSEPHLVDVASVNTGDILLDYQGNQVEAKKVDQPPAGLYTLVRITIDGMPHVFTSDHRMTVVRAGQKESFPASEVREGQRLCTGLGESVVQKVESEKRWTRVFKIAFKPDVPVEVFPKCTEFPLTYGARAKPARRGGGRHYIPAENFDAESQCTYDSQRTYSE